MRSGSGLRLRSGGGAGSGMSTTKVCPAWTAVLDRTCGAGPLHASVLDQPLDLGARLLGQKRREEVVEPHAVVLGLDDQRRRRDGGSCCHGIRPRAARRALAASGAGASGEHDAA